MDELPIGLKFKVQQFLQKFNFSHLCWDGIETEGCEVTVFGVGDNPHGFGVSCFMPDSPTRLAIEALEEEFREANLGKCEINI